MLNEDFYLPLYLPLWTKAMTNLLRNIPKISLRSSMCALCISWCSSFVEVPGSDSATYMAILQKAIIDILQNTPRDSAVLPCDRVHWTILYAINLLIPFCGQYWTRLSTMVLIGSSSRSSGSLKLVSRNLKEQTIVLLSKQCINFY